MKCERCGKEFSELSYYESVLNINEDDKHSLIIEYNGNAGEELEEKYGEEFWERASNTEMSVKLILGGECCEGDYIIIGSDFNELQNILQATIVIVAEHHAENHLNVFEVIKELQNLMKEGKVKKRIVHWG